MEELDALLQSQYGLVTRQQALALRSDSWLRRAVANGQLVGLRPGVYRVIGAASTFRQRAMAACLALGPPMAVSHTSAAFLWRFEAVIPVPPIEVSVPKLRSGRRLGIQVHHVVLPDTDVVVRFGIPVTCTGRTLLDLAEAVGPVVVERCLDDALRQRQATAAELIDWLGSQDRRGRPGTSHLRRLLDHRIAAGVGDSVGVDRIERWIRRAGLPPPILGLAVVVAGRQRVVDLAYPDARIAIEFNGWEFHQMRSRMDADHARTTEFELAGWMVITVTAGHGEAETIDRITQALTLRRSESDGPRWRRSASGMLGR